MIDAEKAIERLRIINHDMKIEHMMKDRSINIAISALEKQIPKKLKYRNFYQGYKCDCGANVPFKMQKYCVDCGQRLEW